MVDYKQLAAGRILAGIPQTALAAMCMMSVGTIAAIESGSRANTEAPAVAAIKRTLEFHGIRFTETGAERI